MKAFANTLTRNLFSGDTSLLVEKTKSGREGLVRHSLLSVLKRTGELTVKEGLGHKMLSRLPKLLLLLPFIRKANPMKAIWRQRKELC